MPSALRMRAMPLTAWIFMGALRALSYRAPVALSRMGYPLRHEHHEPGRSQDGWHQPLPGGRLHRPEDRDDPGDDPGHEPGRPRLRPCRRLRRGDAAPDLRWP